MRHRASLAAAIVGMSLLTALPALAQQRILLGVGLDGRPGVVIRPREPVFLDRGELWRQRREDERLRAYEEGQREARRELWRQRREEERAQAYEEGRRDARRERWRQRREEERLQAYEQGRRDLLR